MKEVTPKLIKSILESYFWPSTLEPMISYTRQHDDTDGEDNGRISVIISKDGDAWVDIDMQKTLRFRMPFSGGGISPRTRNALLILAEAIRLDNEERKQK